MADRFPSLELQQLFVKLNEEIFGDEDNWFGSGLVHSIFTPAITLWLMMQQAFHRTSLRDTVAMLNKGVADLVLARNSCSKKAQSRDISHSTGAFAQARQRLGLKAVEQFVSLTCERLIKRKNSSQPATYLIDGTMLTLSRTPDIVNVYGRHSNHRGQLLPQARVVFAAETQTGVLTTPSFGTPKQSEQALCLEVLAQLPKGSRCIGDSNFGVFSVVSSAIGNGLIPIVRLTDARAKKILGQTPPRTGDISVMWTPSRCDKKSTPDTTPISGRVVCQQILRKGFKPIQLYLFTTESKLSSDELTEIYGQRWQIEQDIRQLKVTLEADYLMGKSAEMIAKELLIRFAAFNLIRNLIVEGAKAVGLDPRRISFKGMLGAIDAMGFRMLQATSDAERADVWQHFLTHVKQNQLYERRKPRPNYPRTVVRNTRNFPLRSPK